MAEILIRQDDSRLECIQCSRCIFTDSDRQTVQAINTIDAAVHDEVMVYIHDNKIVSAFILYLLPLFVFFLFFLTADKILKYNELFSALAGFLGFCLFYFILYLFEKKRKTRNYIISKA